MSCHYAVNMIHHLIVLCKCPPTQTAPLSCQEMHALLRLRREVLLDLIGVVHVQIPVLLLDIGNELV